MGLKALRSIRFGRESTAGTPVAATTYWRGTGTAEFNPNVTHADEDIGNLMRYNRAYSPKEELVITLDETPATFEQIAHLFEMGVRTDAPAADGGGNGYIYEYVLPTTSVPTLKTYTVEYGDDAQAYESAYVFAEEITLSGEAGGAVMMGATLRGRSEDKTTFTGAATIPTVEEILFQKGKVYIDNAALYPDTPPSTQDTATWLGFSLTITTGWVARWHGDGNLYFTAPQQAGPDLSLEITYEHNATAVGEIDTWKAITSRGIRLEFEGSAFGTGGDDYNNKTLLVDLFGNWETVGAMGDQDGNNTVTLTLKPRYDATATSAGQVTVVNDLSALP
jgi:hypothetical protein